MEENNNFFQEEHLNFLNFNSATQKLMKVFPNKFPLDQNLRKNFVNF